MRRPTIADVARKAEVSTATVDRVINGRVTVREETVKRVYAAAHELGYHAAGLIRQRLDANLPTCTFGFLLTKSDQHFYRVLGEAFERATRDSNLVRGWPVVEFVEDNASGEIAHRLREMGKRVDAIAAVSADHPRVTEVIEDLRAKGVPVFSLLSDFSNQYRAGYVGVDNRKAGRAAAWAISRISREPGKVALFVGTHRFLGHEMREMGFRTYFREYAPSFEILDSQINLEEPRISYEETLQLLRKHPDLVGINVAGGGMEGVIEALRDTKPRRNIVVVCNEITPETRAALADGVVTMVIATPIEQLATELVSIMANAVRGTGDSPPKQTFIPFNITISENI